MPQPIEIALLSDRHFWHGGYDKANEEIARVYHNPALRAEFGAARVEEAYKPGFAR